jgi:spermidine synthase
VYVTSEILQFDISEKRSLVLNEGDLERSVTTGITGITGTDFFFQTSFFPDFAQTISMLFEVLEFFPTFVHVFPTAFVALATDEDCPIRAITTSKDVPSKRFFTTCQDYRIL